MSMHLQKYTHLIYVDIKPLNIFLGFSESGSIITGHFQNNTGLVKGGYITVVTD